jgi:hypothetical protein
MKPGDLGSPAAMGDGSTGAAGRCPSVSSRGWPPSSPAAAVEELAGACAMDDVAAAGAGAGLLPVSRCTTLMNSCAWRGRPSACSRTRSPAWRQPSWSRTASTSPATMRTPSAAAAAGLGGHSWKETTTPQRTGAWPRSWSCLAATSSSVLCVSLQVSCSSCVPYGVRSVAVQRGALYRERASERGRWRGMPVRGRRTCEYTMSKLKSHRSSTAGDR